MQIGQDGAGVVDHHARAHRGKALVEVFLELAVLGQLHRGRLPVGPCCLRFSPPGVISADPHDRRDHRGIGERRGRRRPAALFQGKIDRIVDVGLGQVLGRRRQQLIDAAERQRDRHRSCNQHLAFVAAVEGAPTLTQGGGFGCCRDGLSAAWRASRDLSRRRRGAHPGRATIDRTPLHLTHPPC